MTVHVVAPKRLGDARFDALCLRVGEAAEMMTDDQILCLADVLHEALRVRRRLRHEVQERVERRLCASEGLAFPF
ncbi:MAG TPA: hypothetical protein VGR32_11825 [Brevundimonas sp.]|uniref:hypothetical protein n=1 Tax=Brevundimonas sp. TaxID=1871086 RepID=UPI002DF08690|nr:hypothetical protein [Brevundimonas sp.]